MVDTQSLGAHVEGDGRTKGRCYVNEQLLLLYRLAAPPADAHDDRPLEGWMLTVIGKGQKERQVPVPTDVIAETATIRRVRSRR